MGILALLLLAVGLSMDAFAVAICKGLAMQKLTIGKSSVVGLWFGGFQGLMPLIGYVLGVQFTFYINRIAPWLAFVLLALIGGNMIREALSGKEEEETDTLKAGEMFILAVATSIDALAVGITFACIPVTVFTMAGAFVNTLFACMLIALTTFIISVAGVNIGHIFGTRYKDKAESAGGVILILIGIKILLEHFGVL